MPIIVSAHKIAYMALPKAGCSTVKRALAQIDPDVTVDVGTVDDMDVWHGLYPTVRFRPHRWEAVADHWRFCVVRDPVKRLLSVYTNRVAQFGELHNSRKLKWPQFAHLTADPDPDFFFSNLEDYMQAASVIRHHVLPAELFVGPDLGAYDRVYRTAELARLADDLQARTGHAVDISRENASEMKLELDDLAPVTIDAIRPRLMREYALLGGFFTNPLA
ncbi:sulfotransferase family 2 domain-containing protein [Aquicoccus porphyridii]|uniref:Sulfotransferase family protein n=1 Tax=Aquicoccus porphyridii TaxID=1852029 RepID=A0A5A9ZVL1_9RHOB|nr:sulfotransferase family 2 domain-containing protein [Aquicoccus porphyridii]KAA0920966.1 sulfotransferase family protein [Aquicoccus porphyridii]RAI56495.1 hypothetical protein DOO74_01095 [Rhodobacteraceae bacterium AsT-22]